MYAGAVHGSVDGVGDIVWLPVYVTEEEADAVVDEDLVLVEVVVPVELKEPERVLVSDEVGVPVSALVCEAVPVSLA